MADIELIAPAVPKNNGTFPIAYGKDIDVKGDGVRLPEYLKNLSDNSASNYTSDEIKQLTNQYLPEQPTGGITVTPESVSVGVGASVDVTATGPGTITASVNDTGIATVKEK